MDQGGGGGARFGQLTGHCRSGKCTTPAAVRVGESGLELLKHN